MHGRYGCCGVISRRSIGGLAEGGHAHEGLQGRSVVGQNLALIDQLVDQLVDLARVADEVGGCFPMRLRRSRVLVALPCLPLLCVGIEYR